MKVIIVYHFGQTLHVKFTFYYTYPLFTCCWSVYWDKINHLNFCRVKLHTLEPVWYFSFLKKRLHVILWMFKNPSCISTEQQGNRDFRLEGVNLSVTSESEPEPFVFFLLLSLRLLSLCTRMKMDEHSLTNCVWAHSPIDFRALPKQHSQPILSLLGYECICA